VAVRIRLARMGRTNRPFYRIGVFDARTRRDGRAIEYIGYYDPINVKAGTVVKEERARYWLSVGALATETVSSIFAERGIAPPAAGPKKKKKAKKSRKKKKSRSVAKKRT